MTHDLLKNKLKIEEENDRFLVKVREFSTYVLNLKKNQAGIELKFKARCFERLYVLMKLATDNCFGGMPVAGTLMARGVIETIGLIVLFEFKISKAGGESAKEKLEIVKRFVFSTRKFGDQKKAIHVLDYVRALKPHYPEIELLYDILCECVHPNWLGVSQFKEFQTDHSESDEIDELVYATVFQSLLLTHKIIEKLSFSSPVSRSP